MTVYWIDPYLTATSQCNGTTDTTTKSGTYAAPWAWTDCLSTSNSDLTTINGTTLADGDEIRIKGLPFSTMFTLGNSSAYCSNTYLYPNNGFGAGDLAEFQATGVVAFDPTQMQEFTGPCEDDYIFMSYYFSTATGGKSDYDSRGFHELLYSKYGSSNKTMKLYYFDSDYYDNTSNQLDGNRYFLPHHSSSNSFTISAGWTSETVQGGITVIPVIWSSTYKSLYFGDAQGSTKTYDWKVNCEHLYFVHQNTAKASSRAYFRFYPGHEIESPRRYQKLGGSTSCYGNYGGVVGSKGSDVQVDKFIGYNLTFYQKQYQYNNSDVILNFGTAGYITSSLLSAINGTHSYTVTAKFGTISVDTYQDYDDATSVFFQNYGFDNLTSLNIKDDAVLAISSATYVSYVQWQMLNKGNGSTRALTFGSNVRSTSDPNVTGINNVHSLKAYGGSLGTTRLGVAQGNLAYTSSNWYDDVILYDVNGFPAFAVPEQSHGVLQLSSANYRTNDNAISTIGTPKNKTFDPTNGTDSNRELVAPLIVFETNDYDGVPIALVPAQTTSTINPALLYNDSANSDILTLQAPTWSTTSDYDFVVPFKVSIPSYTQGSSTITVSVDLSVTSGLSSSTSSVRLWGAYRDTASTNDVGLDSSSSSATNTLSTSDSSPTTVSFTLSPPSSGQEKINSAVVFVALNIASANKGYNSKLKIHDVSVSAS